MPRKEVDDAQEPLLSAVARKLGQAAGTLANMTHVLMTEPTRKSSDSAPKKSPGKRALVKKRKSRSTTQRAVKAKKRGTGSRTAARQKRTSTKRGSRNKR